MWRSLVFPAGVKLIYGSPVSFPTVCTLHSNGRHPCTSSRVTTNGVIDFGLECVVVMSDGFHKRFAVVQFSRVQMTPAELPRTQFLLLGYTILSMLRISPGLAASAFDHRQGHGWWSS